MKHAEPDFLQGYKAIYQPFKIDKRCIECQKELRTEITKLKAELAESIPRAKVQKAYDTFLKENYPCHSECEYILDNIEIIFKELLSSEGKEVGK